MTDTIASIIETGGHIQAIPAEDWQDAIFAWDLLRMNRRLLNNLPSSREGIVSRQTVIQGAVKIGKGTTIGPNTVITGPVVIGNDCIIGSNCCIQPNTSIGSRATLEPFTYIGNSLVMDDTTIGSHSRITDTVIGERCKLADHTSSSKIASVLDIEGTLVRSEFGAILGDNVVSGPFTIYKNSIAGNNTTIEGNESVISRIVPDGSLVI
jgi:glucose-1-phosphate thymidylyltransferase